MPLEPELVGVLMDSTEVVRLVAEEAEHLFEDAMAAINRALHPDDHRRRRHHKRRKSRKRSR